MKTKEIFSRVLSLALALTLLWGQVAPAYAASLDETVPTEGASAVLPEEAETPTPTPQESDAAPDESEPAGSQPEVTEPADGAGETDESGETPIPAATESPLPEESKAPEADGALTELITQGGIPAGDELLELLDGMGAQLLADEVVAPEETAGDPARKQYHYRVGYGVPFSKRNNVIRLLDANQFFAPEAPTEARLRELGLLRTDTYGHDQNYFFTEYGGLSFTSKINDHTFCVLPRQEMLGRVPDREFEGWYVYEAGTKTGNAISNTDNASGGVKSWNYDASLQNGEAMTRLPESHQKAYGPADLGYEAAYKGRASIGSDLTYGALGDTWDGGRESDDSSWGNYFDFGYRMYLRPTYDSTGDNIIGYEGFMLDQSNPVSIVGRWVASSQAALVNGMKNVEGEEEDGAILTTKTASGTTSAPTLYQSKGGADPILGKGPEELEALTTTGFDPAVTEYYLRVPANVTTLDLVVNAIEPYYDYNRAQDTLAGDAGTQPETAPVTVVVTTPGGSAGAAQNLAGQMLPAAGTERVSGTDYNVPRNSAEDPAHSRWSIEGIALLPSQGTGKLYNTVELTVTAPNGVDATTYTFHIQRLAEPALTQKPGNTPFGMLERSWLTSGGAQSDPWPGQSGTVAEKRLRAKNLFAANSKFDSALYPVGTANNGGSVFRDTYGANAWLGGKNIDQDSTAIVVYQDRAFKDPGIALTDAQGAPVDIAGSAAVKRTLKLRWAAALSADMVGDDKGEARWYTKAGGRLATDAASDILIESDGSDQVDLRGLNVLPGIYTMEYSYTDPISGKVYDSRQSSFVDPEKKSNAAAFSRTVVVLPIPGDVDMDGAVSTADAAVLREKLEINTSTGVITFNDKNLATDASAALFAYRVCDTDHNNALEKAAGSLVDADWLERVPQPLLTSAGNTSNSDYYYLPLPSDAEGYTRKELSVGTGSSKATLSLKYLGKEKGVLQNAGHTANIAGPWQAQATDQVELKDVFWLGVYIENADRLPLFSGTVTNFSFGLTYDARYVKPAIVVDETQAGENTGDEARWRVMMTRYNIGMNSDANRTLWTAGSGYAFAASTGYGQEYTTHYSKAILPLEDQADAQLQELTFAIRHPGGGGVTPEKQGYLLVVPFTLINHPHGLQEAELVEMMAGMCDFTVVAQAKGATYGAGARVLDMAQLMAAAEGSYYAAGAGGTGAYSAQDAVFGGATVNLRDYVSYAAAGVKIPLGKDQTKPTQLYNQKKGEDGKNPPPNTNAVYDVAFEHSSYLLPFGATVNDIEGTLPPGIHFETGGNQGTLKGTPTEAGDYYFSIQNRYFYIKVEPKPLKFWAENKTSYYGESEYRGNPAVDMTFRYDESQISQRDQEAYKAKYGEKPDGDGARLGDVLMAADASAGYTAPTFRAVLSDGITNVSATTPVGTYPIVTVAVPETKNYTFTYTTDPVATSRGLSILKRPFRVAALAERTNVGSIYSDATGRLSDRKAVLPEQEGKMTFRVTLPETLDGKYEGKTLTDVPGYTGGILLPGDSLEFDFTATFLQTPEDQAHQQTGGTVFWLTQGQEERDVHVSTIILTGGTNAGNYTLLDSSPTEEGTAYGIVQRRNVEGINIVALPAMTYQSGDYFSGAVDLRYNIQRGAGVGQIIAGDYPYTEDVSPVSPRSLGLKIRWVTAETKEAGGVDGLVYRTGQVLDMSYNGCYICVSYEDEVNHTIIKSYSSKPLTITPRTLTLTANSTRRAYGEDTSTPGFTYIPAELSSRDYEALTTYLKSQGQSVTIDRDQPRDGAELAIILKSWEEKLPSLTQAGAYDVFRHPVTYVPPSISVVRSTADIADDSADYFNDLPEENKVTSSTKYSATAYAACIYGARTETEDQSASGEDKRIIQGNYTFRYVRTATDGSKTTKSAWGASPYYVEKRLVVLQSLLRTPEDKQWTIYADSYSIEKRGLTLRASNTEGERDVTLALPSRQTDDGKGTIYYAPGAVNEQDTTIANYVYANPSALVNGDELTFSYTVTLIPTDGSSYVYRRNNNTYFNMGSHTEKDYYVQVSNILLTNAGAAENYTLVFDSYNACARSLPQQVQMQVGIQPENTSSYSYYVPRIPGGDGSFTLAQGKVVLRPIIGLELVNPGRVKYTYGEQYDPSSNSGNGMQVSINYANDPEINNSDRNATTETVTFSYRGAGDGVTPVTTFSERLLSIYYITEEQKLRGREGIDDAVRDRKTQKMNYRQFLPVEPYDGKYLVVVTVRGETDNIYSNISDAKLAISPKELTVTADRQNRIYGEANGAFSFTFDVNQLARPDREALDALALRVNNNGAALAALAGKQGYTYQAPTFRTDATPASSVISSGLGYYEIKHNGDGALSNYKLVGRPGELHVYPRPIKITDFVTSTTKPIYTIFSDTSARTFPTNISNRLPTSGDLTQAERDAIPLVRFEDHSTVATTGAYQPADLAQSLPVTRGRPIYGNDKVDLELDITFTRVPLDSQNMVIDGEAEVKVNNARLVGTTAGNYVLEMRGAAGEETALMVRDTAVGMVDKRTIGEITILQYPQHFKYTYGSTSALDMSDLVVAIKYQKITAAGETTDIYQNVPFQGAADFAKYGLYLSYYDSDTIKVPGNGEAAKKHWLEIIQDQGKYRRADMGDHLTRAYTHDSQLDGKNFTANGKYLVVSAMVDSNNPEPSRPIILGTGPNVATPITVDPLELRFTLEAQDKTYDGTTAAVGTMTLTNAFQQAGRVDAKNLNGVTDMVYLVRGAAEERNWNQLTTGSEADFKQFIASNGGKYAFSTGTSVLAGAAPLGVNGRLDHISGSYSTSDSPDKLTFRFRDPNVAYANDPSWDSYGALSTVDLEVLGIRLAGPDAANYTLLGLSGGAKAVTADNVGSAKGYQGSALPNATIRKANRPSLSTHSLPQVQVDEHSNVVRILFGQSLGDVPLVGAAADQKTDELHFEYALQYLEGDTVKQWAGENGTSTWWDGRFFGGEWVQPPATPSYVPKDDDISKYKEGDTVKGQYYPWAREDTGVTIDEGAYPGGASWPGYVLYQSERTALPRGTTFIPVVRAAESWNYNASPAMSSVVAYAPNLIEAVIAATEAGDAAALAAASQAARAAALDVLVDEAQAASQAEVARLAEIGETGKWPAEEAQTLGGASVRTYDQRLALASVQEMEGKDVPSGTPKFRFTALESVWFTDLVEFGKKEHMDAAARNHDPVRYHRYYWDPYSSAEIDFEGKESSGTALKLDGAFTTTVTMKDKEGAESQLTVSNDARSLLLYAGLSGGGGGGSTPISIRIVPEVLFLAMGDDPVKLEVEVTPSHATVYTPYWISSDESVARVEPFTGKLTLVGPGTATITVRAPSGCSDSITVTVVENWHAQYPNSILDFGSLEHVFLLDGQARFWPNRLLTRGEAAVLLSRLYVPNPNWTLTGPRDFHDLTGKEYYAEAARLLGSVGVFQGLPDGSFAGEQIITRAELTTLLARMMGIDVPDTKGGEHAFTDSGEEDTWAYAYIDAMSKEPNVLQGVGGGYFAPSREITRAETAALVTRLLRFQLDRPISDLIVPVDVKKEHWAFEAILRGLNAI